MCSDSILKKELKIGHSVGSLVVIDIIEYRRGKRCKCQCGCGKILFIAYSRIYNNKRVTCGCKNNQPNLLNKRFGKLLVVGKLKNKNKNNRNRTKWECLCDCGSSTFVGSAPLLNGSTKSCGCLRKEVLSMAKWSGYGEISGQYVSGFKHRAKNNGRAFDVSIEFLWELFLKQDRKCAISGVPINFVNGRDNRKISRSTASLDRIDSLKDYTEGNVQWVHKDVNFMKQEQSDEKFIDWCHIISNYQNNKTN